jgi:hypothetical protein
MRKNKATNFSIRVTAEERTVLENFAKENKLKLTELIRLAIDSLCLQTRMNGGELFLAQNTPAAQKFLAQETLKKLRTQYGSLDNVPENMMPGSDIADAPDQVKKLRAS